jgi:hypothetical protein
MALILIAIITVILFGLWCVLRERWEQIFGVYGATSDIISIIGGLLILTATPISLGWLLELVIKRSLEQP